MSSVGPSTDNNEEKVITEKPKASSSSSIVSKEAFLPIGLEELLKTDQIVIQQMTGLMANCCCCYEGENIYEISGNTIFLLFFTEIIAVQNCSSIIQTDLDISYSGSGVF